MGSATLYMLFCAISVVVLKKVNEVVDKPYMDEPFHIPQAQSYCNGDFYAWDPKITTPPGLYIMSLVLKRIFLLKCTLPMLRLTTTLALMSLPIVVQYLLYFHKRLRQPRTPLEPSSEAVVLSFFPIAWFFGFLYYTEVPSLVFVIGTVVAATRGSHWLAAFLGLVSCTFRQTNVIWVLYAYALSQLMSLRFRRVGAGVDSIRKLHDPPALHARPSDLVRSVVSAPGVAIDVLPSFIPYALVLVAFGAFVIWNGGIVLGDKSNHIPALHVPQLYYFVAFCTAFGWPVLVFGRGGPLRLLKDVKDRMLGSPIRIAITVVLSIIMGVTVKLFTIHHPFLLSDNRHYTFYVWRRIYMAHWMVPYLLIPLYVACAWAWFLRVGRDQTLLQTLILPLCVVPTLLPTPLLEPRYFLIPYILLRCQVSDVTLLGLVLESAWYILINGVTMGVFLYLPRSGVGRFIW